MAIPDSFKILSSGILIQDDDDKSDKGQACQNLCIQLKSLSAANSQHFDWSKWRGQPLF